MQRENKLPPKKRKERYAELSQLIGLANLYERWPIPEPNGQSDADVFVREHMEPFWNAARAQFGHPDFPVALTRSDGRVLPYNSVYTLHDDAHTLHEIFQATANGRQRNMGDLFRDFVLPAVNELEDFSRLRICLECRQLYVAVPKNKKPVQKNAQLFGFGGQRNSAKAIQATTSIGRSARAPKNSIESCWSLRRQIASRTPSRS
jgi:hypothetical protein